MRIFQLIVLAAAFFALAAAPAQHGVKVGNQAPDWSNLPGVDDKKHSLRDYRQFKILILVFTCNHCPVAQAYQDRLIALQNEYQNKDARIIAVNVNKETRDGLEKMKERAKEKKYNFPYLFDDSQKIARDYGAKVTPHVFVLDKDRKVAYIGSIDDNMNEKKVKERSLKDTLDALLSGKKPPKTETKAFGCSIKYEKEKQ